jgi:hypothetical protein
VLKKLTWGALALVVLCSAAFAGFGTGAPAQEVARESLDLLKSMGPRNATAHTYLSACVTAIAQAKRVEGRRDAGGMSIHRVWTEAAGRCRGMANAVCDVAPLEAPHAACNRIRGFEPVM